MIVKIQKIGNSKMVTLPSSLISKSDWPVGENVEIIETSDGILIQKVEEKQHLSNFGGAIKLKKGEVVKNKDVIKSYKFDRYKNI